MAESNTLSTIRAPFFGMNFSVFTASVADLPRIVSTTRRHFCGEMRAYRKTALVCMPLLRNRDFLVAGMRFEGARGRKFAELVADHVFRHQHRHMQPAVVHGNGQSDHIGDDHGAPRPGLDRAPIILLTGGLHFLCEVQIHEWAFLERTRQGVLQSLDSFVLAALKDHAVGALVAARLLALGLQSPRAHRMRVALTGLAFTAAVGVIDRVHDDAAYRGTYTQPAHGAGLAEHAQVVFVVADLADRGAAIDMHLAHFARLQSQAGIHAFASRELRRSAGAARHLPALADLQFDVVHRAADRNVPQRHRVAGLDRRIRAGADLIAGLHALRRQNVAALAVLVEHQREMRGAVRIVFEALDHSRNPVLVALEINQTIALLVAAADVARGLAAGMVAGAGAILLGGQGLKRSALVQVRAIDFDHEARTR